MLHYTSTRSRTRCWLEWIAPNSTSTVSVLGVNYITPVPLLRTGQDVSFVYFSFPYWVHLAQLKHPLITLRHWRWLPVQYFLARRLLPWAVPALLIYCSILSYSHLRSTLWSNKSLIQLLIFSHSFSAWSVFWAKQFHLWCSPFITSTISSACVMKAMVMVAQTGPPRASGEGVLLDSRKGIGTRRGSLLNLARNFFLNLFLFLLLN